MPPTGDQALNTLSFRDIFYSDFNNQVLLKRLRFTRWLFEASTFNFMLVLPEFRKFWQDCQNLKDSLGLHSEIQASLGYRVRSCLKTSKGTRTKNREISPLTCHTICYGFNKATQRKKSHN